MKKRYCLIGLGKIEYNLAISLDNKKFNFDFWDIDQNKTKKLSKKLKKKSIINLKNYLKKKGQEIILLLIPYNKINHNLSIQKINSLKFLSKKQIVKINSDISDLIKLFLSHQENPTKLFSIFNWLNSHNSSRKNENVFVNILRNVFGNHKLNKN